MNAPVAKIEIFMQGGCKVELFAHSEDDVNDLMNTFKTGLAKGGIFTVTVTHPESSGPVDRVIHYFIAQYVVHFCVITLRSELAPL